MVLIVQRIVKPNLVAWWMCNVLFSNRHLRMPYYISKIDQRASGSTNLIFKTAYL